MIGTAIKKYAEVHGMTCDGGYAYGRVNGWHIAMLDSYGVKMLQVYLAPLTRPLDEAQQEQAARILEDCDEREFRLIRRSAVNVDGSRAVVVFQDGPGAIKRIERYIDEIVPRLDELALDVGCAYCGEAFEDDVGYLRMDDYILPLHTHCMSRMAVRTDLLQPPARRRGSGLWAAFGAFLGATLGAIPWAFVYYMGYISGILGLLIGFLANFFYGRFGGGNGRVRRVVVVLALVFGVLLGQTLGLAGMFWEAYQDETVQATGVSPEAFGEICLDMIFVQDDEAFMRSMYDHLKDSVPWYQRIWVMDYEQFAENIRTDADAGSYLSERKELRSELLCNTGLGILLGLACCANLFSGLREDDRRKGAKYLK